MTLNVIRGVQDAESVLTRVDPLDLSSLPDSVVARTRQAFGEGVTPEQSVVQILRDVRQEGDEAVRRYAKLLDGADLEQFQVDDKLIARARESVSPELWESLELAAQRVRDFHEATMPQGWLDRKQGLGGVGAALGTGGPVRSRRQRRLPIHRADDRHSRQGGRGG